jgi:hypothetical protein
MCSQVTDVEWLLHETLASVHQNILRPVRVNLNRETNAFPHFHGFLHAFSFLLCFVSAALVLRQRRCDCVSDGGDMGAGGSHRCGGRPRRYNACDSTALHVKDAED